MAAPPNKAAAQAEKDLGTAAYKKRDFATALEHYDAALLLDPTDCVFLLNKASVYLDTKQFAECVATCNLAADVAMENRAEYSLTAKAYARAAKAYVGLNQLEQAVKLFDKALSNDRNPDYLKAKQLALKDLKEQQRKAYIDLDKSREAKERGNEKFKQGAWPEAIKEYEEAIKRNPDDAKIFSNRALCYTKLMAFDLAVKDCDECLRLEPTFAKGHVRKGNALAGLTRYDDAITAFRKALDLEPQNAEAKDGLQRVSRDKYAANSTMTPEERRARAQHDPEVQAILGDAVVQSILQQMQNDPSAAQEHLKNPVIRAKIAKLVDSGILEVR